MRPIGFSTGALAKSDFQHGIDLQTTNRTISAIELSALRDYELRPLVEAIHTLDVKSFSYVSFHAPSKLGQLGEDEAIDLLSHVPAGWPLVVHPEIMLSPAKWKALGRRLCIENMDNRKPTGRTVREMRELFAVFPEAVFCLDLGHARQIDPTMAVALLMLSEFEDRLVQLHISEVGPAGEHLPVRGLAETAFRRLAHRVPPDCAIIIESIVKAEEIDRELHTIRRLFDSETAQRAIA